MKMDTLKKAFEHLKPTEAEEKSILNRILKADVEPERIPAKSLFPRRKIALVFSLALVVLVTMLTTQLLNFWVEWPKQREGNTIGNEDYNDIGLLQDQFRYMNRHYTVVTDERRAEIGFSKDIRQEDIGDKIGTIETSIDPYWMGRVIYEYVPAQGEAIVAVKEDDKYRLFEFYAFERYLSNQDEDVDAYLKLYGIESAEDILKIQLFRRSQSENGEGTVNRVTEITLRDHIKTFYLYYSVMKDSSELYFEKLYSKTIDTEEDKKPFITEKTSEGVPGDTPGAPAWGGVDRLKDAVTIRIVNRGGVYMDVEYYPEFGFISRHEVSDAFADFLGEYINK